MNQLNIFISAMLLVIFSCSCRQLSDSAGGQSPSKVKMKNLAELGIPEVDEFPVPFSLLSDEVNSIQKRELLLLFEDGFEKGVVLNILYCFPGYQNKIFTDTADIPLGEDLNDRLDGLGEQRIPDFSVRKYEWESGDKAYTAICLFKEPTIDGGRMCILITAQD